MWNLQTIRLHCESVTLMDTFKHGKLPRHIIESGKKEGASSFKLWLSERLLLSGLISWGLTKRSVLDNKGAHAAEQRGCDALVEPVASVGRVIAGECREPVEAHEDEA